MMPSQLLLQSPQADQPEKAQSTSGSHRTPSLQLACTLDAPDTGLPHWLTSARITREHQVTPPSHVLEQGSPSGSCVDRWTGVQRSGASASDAKTKNTAQTP